MEAGYYYYKLITKLLQTVMETGETVNLSFFESTEFDSQQQHYGLIV